MKYWFVLAVVATFILSGNAHAADEFDLGKLSWLEGVWKGAKDGVDMEEHWSSTSGKALIGMHRDVKDGRMVSWEFFRVDTTKDGTFYFASPRSAPPTPFRLIALEARRVVFENKEHDFPQRILYWLDERGALHARIEGVYKGKQESEEWTWTKGK